MRRQLIAGAEASCGEKVRIIVQENVVEVSILRQLLENSDRDLKGI